MCRWMGSHFHDSTDYNGVVFSSIFNRVTKMGSHVFGTARVRKLFAQTVTNMGFITGNKMDPTHTITPKSD